MSENKEYVSQLDGQNNIHISQDAIFTVVAMAAVEVEGVSGLSHLGSDVASVKKNLSRAIRLRTEEDKLIIDLSIVVSFGFNMQVVAASVQNAVLSSVESVTGLKVTTVNVHVSGVAFDK